jgi:hypothetical protein
LGNDALGSSLESHQHDAASDYGLAGCGLIVKETIGLLTIIGLILVAIVPLSFYYIGTLNGVNMSLMSEDLVYLGAFMFVFFIALLVLATYRRR